MNIEELLTRYFNADTTVSEERQLREYFAQPDVPEHLRPYAAMFATLGDVEVKESEAKAEAYAEAKPDAKSEANAMPDARSEAKADAKPGSKSGVISIKSAIRLLAPLVRAAACVAVVVTIIAAADEALTERADTCVLTPSNSQTVGIEVSEWTGLQIVDCDTTLVLPHDDLP